VDVWNAGDDNGNEGRACQNMGERCNVMREQGGNGTGTTTSAATTTMTTMRDAGGETDGTRTIVDAFAYVAIDAVESGFDVTRLSNEGEVTAYRRDATIVLLDNNGGGADVIASFVVADGGGGATRNSVFDPPQPVAYLAPFVSKENVIRGSVAVGKRVAENEAHAGKNNAGNVKDGGENGKA
jgi:hypothetical protein